MTTYDRNLAIEEIKEKLQTEQNEAERARLEELLERLNESFDE